MYAAGFAIKYRIDDIFGADKVYTRQFWFPHAKNDFTHCFHVMQINAEKVVLLVVAFYHTAFYLREVFDS
jgi:hypothetical protein